MVYTRRHHNVEPLKQALLESVDNFPVDVVRKVVDGWLIDFDGVLGKMAAILNDSLVICTPLYL